MGTVNVTPELAFQKLSTSETLLFKGKAKRRKLNNSSSIWINNDCMGDVIDTGLSSDMEIISGDTLLFTISYGDLEMIGENTGQTFVYTSEDGETIGYAQDTLVEFQDGEHHYVYYFYDLNIERRPYYYFEEKVYDFDGEIIAESDYSLEGSIFSKIYEINLSFYNNNVDIKDRIFIYKRVLEEVGISSH